MYDLFSDFFNSFDGFDIFTQPSAYKQEKKCPTCGHTYSDFRRTSKLGCGDCYKTFRVPITETLKQIHSTSVHTGKVPSKSGKEIQTKRKYELLKSRLQDAVKNEDYEAAAKIHKEIRDIEKGGLS